MEPIRRKKDAVSSNGAAISGKKKKMNKTDNLYQISGQRIGPTGNEAFDGHKRRSGLPAYNLPSTGSMRQKKNLSAELDLRGPIELVALSVKELAVRCRFLGSERVVTLRARRHWDVIPGEIVTVQPHKQWSYAGHPYLSGEILSTRIEIALLGLTPLQLEYQGMWRPEDPGWRDENQENQTWTQPILARGHRQTYRMEQIVPGRDTEDWDSDPIGEFNNLKDNGNNAAAHKILMELCQADLRCLDAHAHLGFFNFKLLPKLAIRHFEVGVRIGELSLGSNFEGLAPWGHVDNRPFLRCMHGFGLCLWRLGRFEEAVSIFDRMLWLNPFDNQGIRLIIDKVRAKKTWEDR